MANITLVTGNRLFGQSLRNFLEGEFPDSQVGYYSHLENLLETKKSPGMLIFDLPVDFNGYQLIRDLIEVYTDSKVLVIITEIKHETYKKLINNGVKGSLPVTAELAELLKAIHEISAGKIYFPYEILKKIMMDTQPEAEKQASVLTEREIGILRLLCDGLSNEQISTKLHLSYDTVKWHRSNILIKCECKNILALYKYALKNKLLQPSEIR